MKWNREAAVEEHSFRSNPLQARFEGSPWHPPRVFCASLADWLDDEVPIEWLAELLKLIHDTPNLDWLLLTKRPENWPRMISALGQWPEAAEEHLIHWVDGWINGKPPANVWIGTSVENQEYADKRIPKLLKIPAKVRFLSCEPLLSSLNLIGADREDLRRERCNDPKRREPLKVGLGSGLIHQIIVGGESGGKRREMKLEWAQSLHDQCKAAGAAFFFKQISAFKSGCLDGVPADLLKQEFPK